MDTGWGERAELTAKRGKGILVGGAENWGEGASVISRWGRTRALVTMVWVLMKALRRGVTAKILKN